VGTVGEFEGGRIAGSTLGRGRRLRFGGKALTSLTPVSEENHRVCENPHVSCGVVRARIMRKKKRGGLAH